MRRGVHHESWDWQPLTISTDRDLDRVVPTIRALSRFGVVDD